MSKAEAPEYLHRLRVAEVEKAFLQVPIDIHEILVLDGIDPLPDLPGFRIRSNDSYGPLPDIIIKDTGDRYPLLDKIQPETAKLVVMVRVRKDLAEMFPGCEFLLPTSTGEDSVVGLRFAGRTVLAEDKSHWEAYHHLKKIVVGRLP